jgi:hypothetical protein
MTDPNEPFGYRDIDGRRHEVLVRATAEGDWQVLDVWGDHTTVVETLYGREDGPEQARAVARDYLHTVVGGAHDAGRERGRAIPDRRGADDHSDRRHRQRARKSRAGAAARPRAAR